jgi:hypothetical protein
VDVDNHLVHFARVFAVVGSPEGRSNCQRWPVSLLRIPRLFHHFSGMEAPTEIYVGTVLALGALVLMLVNWRYKPKQRPEDGGDRAARRERAWYGNSEQNKVG